MENKQTAVKWLFQQFENGDMYNVEDAQRILHVALKMEKEQIIESYWAIRKKDNEIIGAEQYYTETYGNAHDITDL